MARRMIERPPDYLGERALQARVREALAQHYGEVVTQWCPFAGEGRGIYGPIVDVAVGPFAIRERFGHRYSEMMLATRAFLDQLLGLHNENVRDLEPPTTFERLLHFNENARCFLCIEIEESGSRKHCLGNLVNASALGRIGVLVARNKEIFDVFIRQRAYLRYLADVEKNTFKTEKALVIKEEQLKQCLGIVRAEPERPQQ